MPQLTLASRITLIGLFSLALAVGIGRFAFTPLLPMMRADGLIDITGGGWLASAHFLGYLIGALSAAVVPCPPRLLLPLCSLLPDPDRRFSSLTLCAACTARCAVRAVPPAA